MKVDRQANRLQVFFDEKPDREICSAVPHGGLRWAPSVGAWQRQLNNNSIWAAKHMDCLRPLSAEQPAQAPKQAEPVSVLDNSCVSSPTPGSIAAQYYNLLHACYPMPEDEDLRTGQIEQITQYLQKEGKTAAHQLALAAAGMGAAFSDNDAVQVLASALMAELGKYNEPGQDDVRRQKPRLEKSQER